MPRDPRDDSMSLYVRNISDWARPDDIRYVFERYGRIRDVYIPLDYYTRRPRGFAYVEFEHCRSAEEAMDALNGYRLHGREIEIEFAKGDRKSSRQMHSKYDAPSRYDDDWDRSRRRRRSRSGTPDRDRRRRSRSRTRSRTRSSSRSPTPDRDRYSRRRRRSSDDEPRRNRSRSRSESSERDDDREESKSRSHSPANSNAENGENGSVPPPEYEEETAE